MFLSVCAYQLLLTIHSGSLDYQYACQLFRMLLQFEAILNILLSVVSLFKEAGIWIGCLYTSMDIWLFTLFSE